MKKSPIRPFAIFLLGVACAAFGIALAAPIFSVIPGAGELTPWLKALKPASMAQISQSLGGGILKLWGDGDWLLAMLLGFFCILLPLLKFSVMWSGVFNAGFESAVWGKAVAATAKYSMVEILLLAILALVVKGLPGGSTLHFEPAAWFFMGSVILSFISAELLKAGKQSRRNGSLA